MSHLELWRRYIIGGKPGWEPTLLAIHSVGDGHGALGSKMPVSGALTGFALLMPWVLVPTITEATLFLTDMTVRRVHICRFAETSIEGLAHIWSVARWGVNDDGTVRVMQPEPSDPPNAAAAEVGKAVVDARREGAYWSDGFTWEMAFTVAQEMARNRLR